MKYVISPLDKARELLRQIELEDSEVAEVPNTEGPPPSPDPGSNDELNAVEKAVPASTDAYIVNSAPSENVLDRIFPLQPEDIMRGIVYSEVFSRPRALRRRVRW